MMTNVKRSALYLQIRKMHHKKKVIILPIKISNLSRSLQEGIAFTVKRANCLMTGVVDESPRLIDCVERRESVSWARLGLERANAIVRPSVILRENTSHNGQTANFAPLISLVLKGKRKSTRMVSPLHSF